MFPPGVPQAQPLDTPSRVSRRGPKPEPQRIAAARTRMPTSKPVNGRVPPELLDSAGSTATASGASSPTTASREGVVGPLPELAPSTSPSGQYWAAVGSE